MTTANEQLASLVLNEPVLDWIDKRRAEGLSWRRISQRLYTQTGGRVDVAPQTVMTWSKERQPAA